MGEHVENEKFYGDAKKYWSSIQPTVDGMLGGYAHISSTDINSSTRFLREFLQPNGTIERGKALDCGAGIGRITKQLLLPNFEQVDMVELSQAFLDEAKNNYLGDEAKRIGNFFCSGLEDFTPEDGYYDVIWCQWVLGQLKDDHLVDFFQRCQKGLAPNGIMFVKENINKGRDVDFDEDDSSYCRPRDHLISLIKQSGLKIVKEEKQKNFPKELYEVRMFAFQ